MRWSSALTRLSSSVLHSIRVMDDVFCTLSRRPEAIDFASHLSAVVTLARLIRELESAPPEARVTTRELVFVHAGYECNCVYYELLHRVVFAMERYLWLALTVDVGDPWASAANTLRHSQRITMRTSCSTLVALANYTHECITKRWRDAPSVVLDMLPQLGLMVRMVRAYGLWNASIMCCNGTVPDADTDSDATATGVCASVTNLLNDVRTTFSRQTGDIVLADGVIVLANHSGTVHPTTDAIMKMAETQKEKVVASASDVRPWTLMVHVVFWRAMAVLWSPLHPHRSMRVAYDIRYFWKDTCPSFQRWQAKRVSMTAKALPGWSELESAVAAEVQSSCDALKVGDVNAIRKPLHLWRGSHDPGSDGGRRGAPDATEKRDSVQ